ncbi:hypothetical protein KL918_004358 [Ogataea parapolymorpha]|uniref:Amidohydrolase-related domain-containing protein n=1 Tax=Ogataea parapolymorpha (strain ATCC 26012 / BCRC 20466 / JCM 22074 / NRRL Y-7560 / DL-1) TaxID=871575 RepID=W1QGL2_OGAPD|nr:hypothetical protein HPODL_00156 [Ogataea parapolymorpha DL-1]ESX00740.1 hypothetical protein HPODL_00156 [Ogataea parapolymorpha DL-1]KAG7865477.1 hypothetical protein KL918_004358 [Ogataea parapolymorpha]KAG7873649.1 hypothetical protein KL916_002253 [Ogataea parapolymorpha]
MKELLPWKLPAPQKYAFVNATVIDSANGVAIEGLTVLTADGKIADVCKGAAPPEYTAVDCTGKYLCPGLFDNHVHVLAAPGEDNLKDLFQRQRDTAMFRAAKNIESMLARGFTSIRDTGGAEYAMFQAIEEGVIKGPRLFYSGPAISQTGGHGDFRGREIPSDHCNCHMPSLGVVADGVTECMRVARDNLRQGAHFLKIMGGGGVASPTDKLTNMQYTEDEIRAIVKVAESYDTFVTAHAYTTRSVRTCVLNGCMGIEHGNLMDDETAQLVASRGVYVTPTLVTYKIMSSKQFSHFLSADSQEKNKVVLKSGLEFLTRAKKFGIKICYGSDLLGSLSAYQTSEFSLRGEVLSAADILKSATITPAEALKVDHLIGQIKPGFYADLLVLERNPLDDISVLDQYEDNLRVVMKDGIVYKSNWDELKCEVKA